MAAMFVNGSVQKEHSLERTFHRCVTNMAATGKNLVSDWLISKKIFSVTARPNESKFGRKHP
jgi:hypothetical protein